MISHATYHDEDALLYRLHTGLQGTNKEVVFVVGAPLTASYEGRSGVSDVAGVVRLIQKQFANSGAQSDKLQKSLESSENKYEAAFNFLQGRAGQDAANRTIRLAVAGALLTNSGSEVPPEFGALDDAQLESFENDPSLWSLSPGVEALGQLITKFPRPFGNSIITSNFDPLVEISINKSGGNSWRTFLSTDGSIFTSKAAGCQVIHIHGFWHGSDTLHTSMQLLNDRPKLTNDFLSLIENKILVVMAYGGWPDIFTNALKSATRNENLFPEILWTFFDEQPSLSPFLSDVLGAGVTKGRVTLYSGINCHTFLPKLLSAWVDAPSVDIPDATSAEITSTLPPPNRSSLFRLAPLECDRPPSIEVWVGREDELRALETSLAKVLIFCGIGGEGKSALASYYIKNLTESEGIFESWDWRDCKEQSDRIRTQLTEVIVRFSHGQISSDDLKDANADEIVDIFVDTVGPHPSVLVLDNVDSYVDLENRVFIDILDKLIKSLIASDCICRLIVTCRPHVQYPAASSVTFDLKGLSLDETRELFIRRTGRKDIPDEEIEEAHRLTNGHAFGLDLIALQVTRVPGTTLRALIDDLRRGREDFPDVLSSIWDKLAHRERTLLRFMAEAVRPENENTIARFSSSQLTQKNFQRAFRALISLNLIVVKPQKDAPDLYDLHPLVRSFVRNSHPIADRSDVIRFVLNQYKVIIGAIGALLGVNLPFPLLERWSQKAELEVTGGFYEDAFDTLIDVTDAFLGSGHVQEYVRVARLLFEAIDWETASVKYRGFDNLVRHVAGALDQLGDYASADNLIARYADTIPEKTARYINLCDMRSYSAWQRGEFESAAEWASMGVQLKEDTNVDTKYDCRHNLALATRDAGNHEEALRLFLKDTELSSLLDDDTTITDGPLFGNVGRCLQLMGRRAEALTCYRRSFRILERDSTAHSKSNRAYARTWIGEILDLEGDMDTAEAFFTDAITTLGASSPVRVREVYGKIEGLRPGSALIMSASKASRIVMSWSK